MNQEILVKDQQIVYENRAEIIPSEEDLISDSLMHFPSSHHDSFRSNIFRGADIINHLPIPSDFTIVIGNEKPELNIPGMVKNEALTKIFDKLFPKLEIRILKGYTIFESGLYRQISNIRKDFFIGKKGWQYPLYNSNDDLAAIDINSLHICITEPTGGHLLASMRMPFSSVNNTSKRQTSENLDLCMYTASETSLRESPYDGESVFRNADNLDPTVQSEINEAIENGKLPTVERFCNLPYEHFMNIINQEELRKIVQEIYLTALNEKDELLIAMLNEIGVVTESPNLITLTATFYENIYKLYLSVTNASLMSVLSAIAMRVGVKKLFVQSDTIFSQLLNLVLNFDPNHPSIIDISRVKQEKIKYDKIVQDECRTFLIDIREAYAALTELMRSGIVSSDSISDMKAFIFNILFQLFEPKEIIRYDVGVNTEQ